MEITRHKKDGNKITTKSKRNRDKLKPGGQSTLKAQGVELLKDVNEDELLYKSEMRKAIKEDVWNFSLMCSNREAVNAVAIDC